MPPDEIPLTPIAYKPGLDGLRCLAVLWVIVHNSSDDMLGEVHGHAVYLRLLDVILGTGWMGVQLFFVLSGYLITLILIKSRGQRLALPTFFARRFLRIFPVYYAFLAVIMLSLPAVARVSPHWVETMRLQQFWYWTYSVNWFQALLPEGPLPHLWSLAVEEQFYLFWPFLVLYLPRRFLPAAFTTVIAVAIVSRTGLLLGGEPWMKYAAYDWTTSRLDALAAGGVLAFLAAHGRHPALPVARGLFWGGAIAILAIILVSHNFAAASPGIAIFNQSIAVVTFFGLVAMVFRDDNAFYLRWLRHPATVWIGRVSYAMYLFHLPVFSVWFNLGLLPTSGVSDWTKFVHIFGNFFVLILLTITLASLSWLAFEKPVLGLKRYFRYADSK